MRTFHETIPPQFPPHAVSLSGFATPPKLEITPPASGTRAVAIAKMSGESIERIVLSNPGSGYTESDRIAVMATVDGQPIPWMIQQVGRHCSILYRGCGDLVDHAID
jgi:hypothetical protein